MIPVPQKGTVAPVVRELVRAVNAHFDAAAAFAEEERQARIRDRFDIQSPMVTDAESGVSAPRGYRL